MEKITKGFGERMSGAGVITPSQCNSCKHWYEGTMSCTAYPAGIPIGIISDKVSHKKPIAGDNGIHWEPK